MKLKKKNILNIWNRALDEALSENSDLVREDIEYKLHTQFWPGKAFKLSKIQDMDLRLEEVNKEIAHIEECTQYF